MDISNIFSSVIEISIISSIIGIVIILLRQLLKGRVNSKWIYIIWFILLFKLLVPIKIESLVSIFNFAPEYMTENNYIENSKIEYENLQQEYNNYINDNIEESNNIVDNKVSYELKQLEQEVKKSKIKNNILEYIIPTIWIIGTIIMILWLIITNIILNLKLNKNRYKDERVENILEKCKNKMNLKRKFNIVINDMISTPALFGIFKVKILIPKEILKLSDENLEYILLHELSHYKRKDIWINYILLFIQSIHWFNPVIWICFKLFRNDLELATDEYALKYLDENKYNSYANALLETLSISINSKFAPSLIGMVDNKENIKRRIIMIKSLEVFKKKKVIITIICIVLIIVFSVVLLTTPKKVNGKDEKLLTPSNTENGELTKETEIIEEDISSKIAKLNTLAEWNENNHEYDTLFVKEISENQIKEIDNIIQRGEKLLASVSWAKKADYMLTFNDDVREDIYIRIAKDGTININTSRKAMSDYTIYAEEDVNYILNLLGLKNEYASLPIIDLNEYNKPMNIYWYGGIKFELGTYGWNTSINGNLSNFVIADSIAPKEILKNKKAVEWVGIQGSYISIYSRDEVINKKLPKETIVKYKIYSVNESEDNAQYKEATRMINGSYYLSELPIIKGEYIVEVYISFGNLSDNNAHYCLKYKS